MFSIPKRILTLEGIVAPSLRSMKYILALAAEGFLVGAGCCAPASIRASMEIVKRTIEQRLANRYMNRSPATLAWASKLNKLAGNPDIRQSPGRYAIDRLALSKSVVANQSSARGMTSGPDIEIRPQSAY